MHRTHLSLYYLVGYLTVAGLALFLVPGFALPPSAETPSSWSSSRSWRSV